MTCDQLRSLRFTRKPARVRSPYSRRNIFSADRLATCARCGRRPGCLCYERILFFIRRNYSKRPKPERIAVLLIVAALDEETLHHLRSIAEDELGLDALVEVHTEAEMRRAENVGAQLIGINNRDLSTFDVSLSTSESLLYTAPANALVISESGLGKREELHRLRQLGFDGFLIGGSLMQSDNPGVALRQVAAGIQTGRVGWGRCNQMNAMQIKICGITNSEDALACAAAGVDMIGLNFSPMSLRCISPASAAEIIAALRRQFAQTKVVGVFVDQELEFVQKVTTDLALDAIQLHGEETPRYLSKLDAPFVIKALRIGRYSASSPVDYERDAILLDTWSATVAWRNRRNVSLVDGCRPATSPQPAHPGGWPNEWKRG